MSIWNPYICNGYSVLNLCYWKYPSFFKSWRRNVIWISLCNMYRVGNTESILIRICICSIRAFHTLLTTIGVKKKIPIVPYHTVLRDTIIAQSIGPNWVLHSYLYWRCSPHLEWCGKIRPNYLYIIVMGFQSLYDSLK